MSLFFKGLALFVAVACCVWLAVLWQWEATSRDMSTTDIVVYLVALPVTVFVLAVLMRWAWRGAGQRAAAAAAASAAAAAGSGAAGGSANGSDGAARGAGELERHATVQLMAAFLACGAGSSPTEVLAAAKDGQPRPTLDPELRDDEGLPVFTARIADLDVRELPQRLEPAIAACRALQPGWASEAVAPTVERALAALRHPLQQAVEAAQAAHQRRLLTPPPQTPTLKADPTQAHRRPSPSASMSSALSGVSSGALHPLHCRLLLGLPTDWSAFEREVARAVAADWIRGNDDGVRGNDDGGSPGADDVALPPSVGHGAPGRSTAIILNVAATEAASGEALLLEADFLLRQAAREGREELVIVAACHSAIGSEAIDRLERNGLLFSSQRRARGRMPAEAAAVLLLGSPGWPADPDATAPSPHLHRPAVLSRDKSADAAGRVDGTTAGETMTQALMAAKLVAAEVGTLICDADQHSSRAPEMHAAALALLPHLDAAEDIRLLASVTGCVEGVGVLIVLACAAESVRTTGRPCLAATFAESRARLAVVVRPGPPPGDTPPSVASAAGAGAAP